MAGNIASRVAQLAAPFAQSLGLDIWDVQYVKEGSQWYLRIFIDKSGGVSLDDCVALTRAVTKPLDDADLISTSYMLEVSSPGIERALTKDAHFEKSIGCPVMLRTTRPRDGVRDFAGVLEAYDGGVLTLRLAGGETQQFAKKETSFVKLDDFDMDDFKKPIDIEEENRKNE